MSGDDQFVTHEVVSTEALRAAALAASLRRGKPIARRRVAMRWLTWLLWGFIFPVIGVLTVLAMTLTLAAVQYFGQTKVLDTAQGWLTEQLGYTPYMYPQKTTEATPYDNSPAPSVLPQLQIDRNYSSHEQSLSPNPVNPAIDTPSAAPASVPAATPALAPSSPSKQPGAQP